MQKLQEFISHLRQHAAQSQDDIVQHSRTIEELKQKINAVEYGLQRMKEEDASVQLTKKQSRVQLRQLQTELEQAYTKHSVAKYMNAQHATRLQNALGFESEMSKEQPPPPQRSRQSAGQEGKGYFRLGRQDRKPAP